MHDHTLIIFIAYHNRGEAISVLSLSGRNYNVTSERNIGPITYLCLYPRQNLF